MKIQLNMKVLDVAVKESSKGVYWKVLAVQEGEIIDCYTKKDLPFTMEEATYLAELSKYKGVYSSIKIIDIVK